MNGDDVFIGVLLVVLVALFALAVLLAAVLLGVLIRATGHIAGMAYRASRRQARR